MKLENILFYAFVLIVSWAIARDMLPEWLKYDSQYQRQIKREKRSARRKEK